MFVVTSFVFVYYWLDDFVCVFVLIVLAIDYVGLFVDCYFLMSIWLLVDLMACLIVLF